MAGKRGRIYSSAEENLLLGGAEFTARRSSKKTLIQVKPEMTKDKSQINCEIVKS